METKEFLGKLIKHNTFGAGEIIEARNIKGKLDTLISLTIRFEDDNLKELVYPFVVENKIVTFMDEKFSKKIDNELYEINNEMSTNKNDNNIESSKSNYWQNKNDIKKFSIFKKLYEFIKSIFVRPKTEKSKCLEDNQTEDLKKIEEVDCIVVKSFPHCDNLNHSVENIGMIIELINEKDQIIEKTITGTHCKTCNKYYIVEPLFKEVLRFGMPNCNIEIYDILSEGYGYNQELKEKSILKEFGYSVGKKRKFDRKRKATYFRLFN